MQYIIGLMFTLLLIPSLSVAQQKISLAGEWEIVFESDDAGSHRMLTRKFSDKINLPLTTDEAKLGDSLNIEPLLNRKVLYQLTRKRRYVGTAWYRRSITIPDDWKGKRIDMLLERVLWQSRVFIDGQQVDGQQESLTTPHLYDLSGLLTPGTHTILLRINNDKQYAISYQNLAHAYTDGTQTIWNGVLGNMGLTANDPVHIQNIQTYPDLGPKSVKLRIQFLNNSGKSVAGKLQLTAKLNGKSLPSMSQIVQIDTGRFVFETNYDLKPNFQKWDEFSTSIYQLDASLVFDGNKEISQYQTTFGVRQIIK